MSAGGANPSSSKPSGFMSGYMSDLSQSQDLNSFLQKNQPTYDPNSSSSTAAGATPSNADTASKDTHTPSSSSSPSSTSSQSSQSSTSSTSTPSEPPPTAGRRKSFDSKAPVGSHPLPTAHAVFQKKAIHNAALDNCADLNMELTDCLMGRAGTWWDRASMCMKAKERFALCCRLNKEALQEKGYAKEGNTAAQDVAILDYADEVTQKAMKENDNTNTSTNTTTQEK